MITDEHVQFDNVVVVTESMIRSTDRRTIEMKGISITMARKYWGDRLIAVYKLEKDRLKLIWERNDA